MHRNTANDGRLTGRKDGLLPARAFPAFPNHGASLVLPHFDLGKTLNDQVRGERRGDVVDAPQAITAERQSIQGSARLFHDAYLHPHFICKLDSRVSGARKGSTLFC